jgi:hypothetical protein
MGYAGYTYQQHAGLLPTSTENSPHRKRPQGGRQRLCHPASQALRLGGERPWAWEATGKRLLRRFARLPQRHDGMQLMAYTLINVRAFCGIENLPPVIRVTAHNRRAEHLNDSLHASA